MKKTVYNDVSISYLANGEAASLAAEGEEAEALAAMAHAHQDIHWHGRNDYIIPWSAVLGVTITKIIEDVSAPHDDICDGYCANKGYSGVDLNGYTPSCVQVEADPDDPGTSWARVRFEKDGAEPFWSYRAIVGEADLIMADGSIAYIKDCAKSPEKNIYGIMGTNSETEGYIKFLDPGDTETVIAAYTVEVCS